MAGKEKKGISDATIGLGLLALAWALGKKPPPPPGEEQLGADISIQIRDAVTGLPVPKNSPALVVEGASYIATIAVTNRSTKTGAPTAATLTMVVTGYAGAKTIPTPAPWSFAFAASEPKFWDITFTVPADTAGSLARLLVSVNDPTGLSVKAVPETLTISSAVIVYAADITITVR